MDTIWDRNPSKSEVIDYCGGDEKTEWPRRTDKSRTLIEMYLQNPIVTKVARWATSVGQEPNPSYWPLCPHTVYISRTLCNCKVKEDKHKSYLLK